MWAAPGVALFSTCSACLSPCSSCVLCYSCFSTYLSGEGHSTAMTVNYQVIEKLLRCFFGMDLQDFNESFPILCITHP